MFAEESFWIAVRPKPPVVPSTAIFCVDMDLVVVMLVAKHMMDRRTKVDRKLEEVIFIFQFLFEMMFSNTPSINRSHDCVQTTFAHIFVSTYVYTLFAK